jgi:hypothetical protein
MNSDTVFLRDQKPYIDSFMRTDYACAFLNDDLREGRNYFLKDTKTDEEINISSFRNLFVYFIFKFIYVLGFFLKHVI